MSKTVVRNKTQKELPDAFPLAGYPSKESLLKANASFHEEILAFNPYELLKECKRLKSLENGVFWKVEILLH